MIAWLAAHWFCVFVGLVIGAVAVGAGVVTLQWLQSATLSVPYPHDCTQQMVKDANNDLRCDICGRDLT